MSNSKKMNFIYIALAIIFLVALGLSFTLNSHILQSSIKTLSDNAEELAESSLNGSFNIKLTSRDDENIALENSVNYDGGKAYKVNWSQAQSFTVSFDADIENPPVVDPENPVYTLSLSLNFLQGYISNNDFNVGERISLENIISRESEDLSTFSNLNYNLNIDSGVTGTYNGNTVTASGWGIYQFVVDINGYEAYSDFYAIEPTYSIANAPKISYTVVSSNNSLHDSFQFYLENFDDYEYIDKTSLVWYVRGKSEDGTMYALCKDDLQLGNFANCSNSIYDSYNRTGQTFFFNDNEISGEWEVWCEYRYNNATYSVSSNIENVKTGNSFDYFIIVYIVIALAVLSIIIIIVASVIKNKKEKVW